jgi:HD-like signal output (HDOD) protein
MATTQQPQDLADSIRIPTLSASVERLRALLSSPDVAIPDVVEAFMKDPPLAAKVLRMANSAHYGLREKTTSMQTAVSVLGLRTLSMIVLHAGVMASYAELDGCEGFSMQEVWRHSVLTARTSENLARRCRRRGTDLAPQDFYTCGLLHDIGKIVLFDNLAEHYVDVVRRAREDGASLEAEEDRLLGIRHSEAGHMAAMMWMIPEPIPSAIRYHHRPNAMAGQAEVAKLVSCADVIANAVARSPTAEPSAIRKRMQSLPQGLSETDLLEVIALALAAWQEIEV